MFVAFKHFCSYQVIRLSSRNSVNKYLYRRLCRQSRKKLHTTDRKAGPMQLLLCSGSQWATDPVLYHGENASGSLPGEPPGWTTRDPWGLTQSSRHDYDWNRPKSFPWSCRLPHKYRGAVHNGCNLRGYDGHLKCLKQLKIRKSAAFQITWRNTCQLQFIDSLQFRNSSLDRLSANLQTEDLDDQQGRLRNERVCEYVWICGQL